MHKTKHIKYRLLLPAVFWKACQSAGILCVFLSVTLIVFAQTPPKTKEYTVTINDTTEYTLQLALDEAGQPLYYFSNLFTPVCLTGECKPVYINFYWDLLGNYTRFDFPKGAVLTRMDHKPFKPEDYEKLQMILANTHSLLKEVSMEDLVGKGTENLADSVDAKAGATLKTVKNEVIDGAVYTCYTLWHIAHGKVVTEMQRMTESFRTDALLHRFLTDNNHHYQYWAMERVMNAEGIVAPDFQSDIQQIIRGKNIFTARFALQKVNAAFFAEKKRQQWLWETYQSAGYPLQLVILKKMATLPLNNTLTEQAAQQVGKSNQEQGSLLLKALATQPKLSEQTLLTLADELTNENCAAEVCRVLEARQPKNRTVQKKIVTFKQTLHPNDK
ncbi:hypothetical protein [Runella salmonicolor]|uniref:Uncharacterized protein n=1 Tax=Runella salmonicolor TaxID=2950278 RepID=A0ABT1FJ32_9BACT|nr:hypothetical protein [Runella salmonicolor]MCP1381781.1 hypothetical protein [Runella salmonicolor]